MSHIQNKSRVKCKLKKGDSVVVISGAEKGQKGTIERVDLKKYRAYVGGVNVHKRHHKPSMAHPNGGIVSEVLPLPVSNLAIVDPKTGKASRVGYRVGEDGRKVRISKASGSVLS
ncbi:MAG: 50S ribosomal protein L24 [Deltaproteobacteria bacterium]|nr:50S ribosomal protein L24 [Deltaproteobacteria bacterium]